MKEQHALLDHSATLARSLHRALDGLEMDVSEQESRKRLVGGCFDAVLEHHASIVLLIDRKAIGSAFALLRPMFDGCINGMWLAHLASEEELKRFLENRLSLEPAKVIKRAEKDGLHSIEKLKKLNQMWPSMSAYVHTGYLQIIRRNSAGHIGANYSVGEINEVLVLANWCALFSAVELAELIGKSELLDQISAAAETYISNAGF